MSTFAYPLVAFTSAPSTTATTRYRFTTNDGRAQVMHDGFDLGAPQIEGDPDAVEVSWGMREIQFTQRIFGSRATAMAMHSQLARELLRPDNWLQVQVATDREPVWFHTYRNAAALSLALIQNGDDKGDAWDIAVSIPAEAFAYGAKVTLGPATITNDPATGTNPCRYVLPAVVGDAPAPLTVQIAPNASITYNDNRILTAVVPHLAGQAPAQIVWQTNGFTTGTDTSHVTGSTGFSSTNRSATTFATNAALVTRLSGAAPTTPPPGRYKVLCRMTRNDASTTFAVRLGQNYGITGGTSTLWGETVRMDRSTTTGSPYATYMDLGEFSFPLGAEGWTADDVGTSAATPSIQLQVQRLSGTGEVSADCFVLIPISTTTTDRDARVLFTLFDSSEMTSGRYGVWDAEKERFRAMQTSSSVFLSDLAPTIEGGFPRVVPGADNVFHLHNQVNTSEPAINPVTTFNSDWLAGSVVVTLSYYPRFLWVGDG